MESVQLFIEKINKTETKTNGADSRPSNVTLTLPYLVQTLVLSLLRYSTG